MNDDYAPRARPRATHSLAPLPLQDALLTNFINEHTAQLVRDVYLRVTAESERYADLLWIRYQAVRETNKTCLRGVPTPVAEAVRALVLEDILSGMDAPLLPRVRERLARIAAPTSRHRVSADTPGAADTPGTVSSGPAVGPGHGAPGAGLVGEVS